MNHFFHRLITPYELDRSTLISRLFASMMIPLPMGYRNQSWPRSSVPWGLAFLAVVSATAYRKGEVWAWYLTWVMPVLFLLDVSNDYLAFRYVDIGSMFIAAILIAGLLLPYRKFFPINQPG